MNSSHIVDAAAEICKTSNVSLERVPPVVFLSKYDFGNFISLLNIATLRSNITLLEIQDPALRAIKVDSALIAIVANKIIE